MSPVCQRCKYLLEAPSWPRSAGRCPYPFGGQRWEYGQHGNPLLCSPLLAAASLQSLDSSLAFWCFCVALPLVVMK